MITIDLPPELDKLLAEMVQATGRSVDQIALEAILERLEDWEDAAIAEERMRDDDGVRIPLEEIMRKYEAQDAVERSGEQHAADAAQVARGKPA